MKIEVSYRLYLTEKQLKKIGHWAFKTQGLGTWRNYRAPRIVVKQFLKQFGTKGLEEI